MRRHPILTAFGVLASTGIAAAASCPAASTTKPFAQFGDTNNYFVAPGGAFEGSSLAAGASTSGSVSLTGGNEPWHVVSASDNQSLTIQSGGSVTLPFTCVDSTMPDFRFFARQVAALRQALLASITPKDMQDVAARLLDLAKDGNVQAAKLLLAYTIGKPQPAPEPDRMDADEWEVYQDTSVMK